MSNVLYLECASGISGDMAVAALLDLGASEEHLRQALSTLPLTEPYEIVISRVKKSGLDTCDFDVVLPKEMDTHDHDMHYLYGHLQEHGVEEMQVQEHGIKDAQKQVQEHDIKGAQKRVHEHAKHQPHTHRGPKEIAAIFNDSAMSEEAKKVALRILSVLTDAEAKAHGVMPDEVHFHEVGAVDSIVDIASFAICFDELCQKMQIQDVIVKEIAEGKGTVRCQHGILPVPVPAVTNIACAHQLHLHMTEVEGELVTPTGAAIAAAVKTKDQLPEPMKISAVGLGAGKRDYKTAGFLRIFLLEI